MQDLQDNETRKCSICKDFFPLTDFHKNKSMPKGRGYHCSLCRVEYGKIYRAKNKAHINEGQREWRIKNPDKQAAIQKRKRDNYSEKDKQYFRDRYLKNTFGVTQEWYEATLASQDGGCAICGEFKLVSKRIHMHIDHNHTTGKIREILCNDCNQLLGKCNESIDILQKSIQYLIKHNV